LDIKALDLDPHIGRCWRLWERRSGSLGRRRGLPLWWPQANIAIATGALSGLVVLDVDSYKGGADSLRALEQCYGPLPETVQQLTGGGGAHYLFAHPGSHIGNSTDKVGGGIDIRGDGGYIIAPPSLHKSGTRYSWEASSEPDETALASMPDWLLALCQETTGRTAPSAAAPIPGGQRNDTLFRMGCSFRARGCTEAVILAALREMNRTQCSPPLAETEVEKIAASCAGYEAGARREPLHQQRNGQTPGPEPTDPFACPELPAYARTQDAWAAEASLFLDDYITLSTMWAPRAYAGFHEAVALFLLSTIAARRVKLVFGPRGVYTSLYIALCARTTIYTKSTTADIGLALLEAAGLSWLLADDDSTPQAFLRSLTRYIPSNYADLPRDEQAHLHQQLAFTAQRGWFYEEWGQHLEAMMQKNGYMASFRSILRRMDDHQARYVSTTIGRGRDILVKPYISLLANLTPSDLQPFVKAHAPLWRDGYIARFAFVAPGQTEGSEAEFPQGQLTFPPYLVSTLRHWHTRLGVPTCILTPQTDTKGHTTGGYTLDVDPLPERAYTLHPDVRAAYYSYDRALRDLTRQRQEEDLDGSYGRFAMKALRIAGLLASLHDDSASDTIWPRHWHRGQQIAERWRRDLHRLRQQVQTVDTPHSPKRHLEDKLLRQVDRNGPQSVRGFALFQKAHSRDEIEACVTALVATGELVEQPTAQTTKYGRPTDGGHKV
jgi:hypothetical protein